MDLRFAVLVSVLIAASPRSFAQERAKAPALNSPISNEEQTSDPDNNRVRVTRFTIAPGENIGLSALPNESLTICLRGEAVSRIPAQGQEEHWAHGPGSAVSNRSGVAYTILNKGEASAEIVFVELKDTYAFNQLRVPWSERDPINQDAAHFRMVTENSHARVLLMHLNPREGTAESQFADRLEIALTPRRESVTDVDGKFHEVLHEAGSVRWNRSVMYSTVNLANQPLDKLIVELKHPFCYQASDNDLEMGDAPENMRTYVTKVKEAIGKSWNKHMPSGVRTGDDRGLVVLQFKIDADGTLPEDSIRFRTVFASGSLMERALSAVRDTSPFPRFPPDTQKPSIELRLFFAYNMPRRPPGCE